MSKKRIRQSYPERSPYPGAKSKRIHRLRAEAALGKPLPHGAQVHHADGSLDANAPLVICQDAAYHKLLHQRMRERLCPLPVRHCEYCGKALVRQTFPSGRTECPYAYNRRRTCGKECARVLHTRGWAKRPQ